MQLTPSDLITLSRLLDDAMDLAPAQVDAWLAGLPAEHEHLRMRLQDMLAAHRKSSHLSFLAEGPKLADAADETLARAEDLVGRYRLIREIGRGGMGTVWLAERADGTLKRLIALKLPRLAWGAGLAERMARERDIGALLEHPNIARLYDAGVDERGRPFLALEYIDGQPLDEWCKAKSLSVRKRLELFIQVARAVAYAHGRLVVHRDLKPSNVLVTADGQVHLLDFGIAKLLDEASAGDEQLTQEQARVLTPHYASPEQIRGETITVASDVYSLGVLLYELLTRRYPYAPERKSLAAIEEAIVNDEPPMASSRAPDKLVAKELGGEIDAILAKALRREPSQRYATADAFAEDIERHLRGDAVLARPDSVGYRLGKVLRRHRIVIAAVGAVLMALLGGAVVSLIQAQRANAEAERARVVKEFVVEVFRVNGQGNPANNELRQLPVEALLERGASLIDAKFPGQPQLQAELFGIVGGIFADMGASHAAAQYATRQIETLNALHASAPEQIRSRILLAQALIEQGRLADAKSQSEQAIQMSTPYPELHAQTQVLNARVLFALGDYDSARRAIDAFDRSSSNSSIPTATHARAVSLRASLMCRADRLDDALPLFRAAVAEGLTVEGPQSTAAIDIRLTAAKYLLTYNRVAQSREFSDAALSALRASGSTGQIRAALEEARLTRGTYRMSGMTFADARRAFKRIQADIAARGPAVPQVIKATIDFEVGAATLLWGDLAIAKPLISQSAVILRATMESPTDLGFLSMYQGHASMYTGRNQEAEAFFRQAIESKRVERDTKNPLVVYSYVYAATNMLMQRHFEEAKAMLASAPDFGTSTGKSMAVLPGNEVRSARARIALESGHAEVASEFMPPEAEDQSENLFPFGDQTQLRGEILCATGHRREGLAHMSQAIDNVAKADFYPHAPDLARARAVAGLCALADGQRRRAIELASLAHESFAVQPDVSQYFKQPSQELDRLLATRRTVAN